MIRRCFPLLVAIPTFALTLGGCMHDSLRHKPVTVSLQGGATMPTCDDRIVSGFYAITLAAFSNGPDKVDLQSYEEKSFAHFRATASSMGATPEQIVDHLKGIPRQVVQIAKEDPKILDSCHNFALALTGPP